MVNWRYTINTLRKLSKYIKKYKRQLILGIVALVITDLLGLCTPWLIKCAIDSFKNIKGSDLLLKYAILIVGVVFIQAVFRFFWRKYLFGLSRLVEYDLRNDYFRHLQCLSASFFARTKTGDLMSRATNDMNAVREFLGMGAMIIVDTIVTISASLGMMFYINARLTFVALLPMIIICMLVMKFGKLIRKRYMGVQAQISKISAMVQESISGIRVVQAYVQENSERKRFEVLNKEYINKNLQLVKVSGVLFPMLTFMSGISAAAVLWLGGKDVIAGKMTLGSFVGFNGYLAMLTWPMMAIGFMVNLIQRGAASMSRIESIMNVEPEICDYLPAVDEEKESFIPGRWDIALNDVEFAYTDADTKSLSNVTFTVNEGSSVGIVGQVGSGKSTIGRLILRNYDVGAGQITIGGIDIKKIPIQTIRQNIGYVDQDPFLFSDTIRENIVFGYNSGQQSQCESEDFDSVWDAAVTAGLEKDLLSFPDGIDTRIGERGVTLSGGQKQRVAIARALLGKSKVLILDDAFSSLDTGTENEIFKRLEQKVKGITTIIISHRISTVKSADMIIVFDKGKIIERGTHQELVDLEGAYYKIYKNQMLAMDMGVMY